jgi:serine/threonine protein kinase
VQSIAIQCLEALQFLHGLGLIHCDLKPENILVKSYSRCEVKVIDLGSSCFETDHLCSYVQSRSYRAPEVILGFPYDKKIDIWSLGCILAELCTGNVSGYFMSTRIVLTSHCCAHFCLIVLVMFWQRKRLKKVTCCASEESTNY